jgi:SAM-dependent methyltransferase
MGQETQITNAKTLALARLLRIFMTVPPRNLLVVGCGEGTEAAVLARFFDCSVVGIDIESAQDPFDHEAAYPARLIHMDARAMDFDDASFDLIYSFHALEHIPDHRRALREMSRTLRPGGTYCIGTPNRSRLLGYLNSPTSLRDKILWNLNDLSMRLRGRWRNECGAHAGFSIDELTEDCRNAFGGTRDVTNEYYLSLYENHGNVINALIQSGIRQWVFPCVYVIGTKARAEKTADMATISDPVRIDPEGNSGRHSEPDAG